MCTTLSALDSADRQTLSAPEGEGATDDAHSVGQSLRTRSPQQPNSPNDQADASKLIETLNSRTGAMAIGAPG